MNITSLINRSNKTRERICAEAQISRGMLSLLERGNRRVGVRTVARLAMALGVKPSDLRPDLAAIFDQPGAAR